MLIKKTCLSGNLKLKQFDQKYFLTSKEKRKGFDLGSLPPPTCCIPSLQGDRSCAKARRAFAEKFGGGQKFLALTYAVLLRF